MIVNNSAEIEGVDEDDDEKNPPIIDWMKQYAAEAGPKTVQPTLEEVKEAIKDDFPKLYASDLDLDHLLEQLGIHVIAEHQDYCIAWFGTTQEGEVEELLSKYQQAPYSNVRRKLGINYLWILNLLPHLGHMRNDIFEADVEFSLIENKPECAIIDL